MKKSISLSLITLLIASFFAGCKKGDNDPFSLLSRKARITGVWNLTSADYEEKDVDDNGTDITSYTYDGTNMTKTIDGSGETYAYSEKITINKDGTFTNVTKKDKRYFDSGDLTWKTGTQTETLDGVWYFLSGNKDLDVKNKERVEFLVEKYKKVDPNGDTFEYEMSGASNAFVNILLLDRLANKEIITQFDYTQTLGGDSYSKSGTMTYTKE